MTKTKFPKHMDVVVGQRIRQRRIELGMSQEALAKSLGVTFQQVQKYEKGSNRMSASRIAEVASLLQVPIEYLFNSVADNGVDDRFGRAVARRDVQQLLNAYLAMNPDAQKSLVRMLAVFSHT